jgi:hypothetical protein
MHSHLRAIEGGCAVYGRLASPVIAPSESLRGAGTAVCAGNEAIPGPRRDRRGGLSPFLMNGKAGLSPSTPVKSSLGFTPLIKKSDCPLATTTSGTVTPFGISPPSKTLGVASPVRSARALGLIKRGDSPPRPSLLGPGIASLPCRRLAMTGRGQGRAARDGFALLGALIR